MNTKFTKTQIVAGLVIAVVLVYAIFSYLRSPGQGAAVAGAQVVSAVASRSVDAQGNATGVTSSFSSNTDNIVYVVLKLNNAKKTSVISYIRYFNGKYVDSKVSSPTADGVSNLYFSFEKGVGKYKAGNYKVVIFVNGKQATEVDYSFK